VSEIEFCWLLLLFIAIYRSKPESLFDNLKFIQIVVSYCLACDNQLKDEIRFDSLISYIKVNLSIF
jgi:hypothetical protein